jgi:formylglycine-generating enzyme required for sulfatase activity
MRTLILLAMIVAFCTACADEPAPSDATPQADPPRLIERPEPDTEPPWLTERPDNARTYTDETLARFAKLVKGNGWRDPRWNAHGTLEAAHVKTRLFFALIPGRGFLLGKTECTQRAWAAGGGTNRSYFKGDSLPVELVSWDDCHEWCRRNMLRLPSEKEWVYACQALTRTRYWSGDKESDLAQVGWYAKNSEGRPHVVGKKSANPFGLHDMHGNVEEWCEDLISGSLNHSRTCLGGSWDEDARNSCLGVRGMHAPHDCTWDLGFRPAADLPR